MQTQSNTSKKYLAMSCVAVLALALWILAGYPFIGQIIIGAYGVVALWRNISSQQVLRLAMVALGVMLVALALGQYRPTVAFAAYAFLLLIVGGFVIGKELWQQSVVLRHEQKEEKA